MEPSEKPNAKPEKTRMNATQTTITAGMTLTARSVGDYDCIFKIQVMDRKGNFATVKTMTGVKRKKIHTTPDGEEYIMALGNYSMAPAFRASSAR